MSQSTHFFNARLVDPASGLDEMGGLLAENSFIVGRGRALLQKGSAEAERAVDCQGHVLAPGLIDTRVFIGEPGAEHKETIASASMAAAAGGVTTIIMMPDTDPMIDDAALVDFIERRARDTAVVRVHPMAALTLDMKGEVMAEMALLKQAGAVGFTEGRKSIASSRVMRRALDYARTIGALIAHHAEDAGLSAGGQMNEGELSTRLGLQGIPSEAESIMVDRDLALVDLCRLAGTGARYHLAQISCDASLAAMARAKDRGLPVTCAVTPHHLALNEVDIATYRTYFKTMPPLRAEAERLALVSALKDGLIDIVASSHEPLAAEDKRLPFEEAAFGVIGLESLLPILLELVHGEHLPLMRALESATAAPARLLEIDTGSLARGRPADLVLIDLDTPYVFEAAQLHSRSRNTPFDGRRLQGRAALTVVGGQIVHSLLEGVGLDAA